MVEGPGAQADQEGTGNIFVIDDDPVFVSYVSTILAQAGHRVETADDPVDGLNKKLPFKPDIIMIDIIMPNLSGLQLMDTLKEACQEEGIRLVTVSVLKDEEDIARAFQAGASDYIVKPIDQKELLFRINHQLRLLRSQRNGEDVGPEIDGLIEIEFPHAEPANLEPPAKDGTAAAVDAPGELAPPTEPFIPLDFEARAAPDSPVNIESSATPVARIPDAFMDLDAPVPLETPLDLMAAEAMETVVDLDASVDLEESIEPSLPVNPERSAAPEPPAGMETPIHLEEPADPRPATALGTHENVGTTPTFNGSDNFVDFSDIELPGNGPKTTHRSAKILLVDDDPTTQAMVQSLLTAKGHTVLEASNGQQALLLAEREEPDLIILDLIMPDMNGYDVCRRLADNPQTASIPIVILTAKNSTADVVRGLTGYADEYITKPFNPEELSARLLALLRRTLQPIRSKRKQLGIIQRIADQATRRGYTIFSRHLNRSQDPPSDWTGPLPDIICFRGDRQIAYLVESLESLYDERALARWKALEAIRNLQVRLIVPSPEAKNLALLIREERDFRAQVEQIKAEDPPKSSKKRSRPSSRPNGKERRGATRWFGFLKSKRTTPSKNGRRRKSGRR